MKYSTYVVDLTDGVEYYLWTDSHQFSNLVTAWNDKHGTTFLRTFTDYNDDVVLAIF